MRTGITVTVTAEDRLRLEGIIGDGNAAQKHVWRAKIILATADGCGTSEIMRRSGKCKPVVWHWQERFMHDGVRRRVDIEPDHLLELSDELRVAGELELADRCGSQAMGAPNALHGGDADSCPLAMAAEVQWVASCGGAVAVSFTTLSITA